MAEKKTEVTERTTRWRKTFLSTENGRITLMELGRELGAFTINDSRDPAEITKLNVWKLILGRLGIINSSSPTQCLSFVEALSDIPPVREEIKDKEE